jgi:hypothetical protein
MNLLLSIFSDKYHISIDFLSKTRHVAKIQQF